MKYSREVKTAVLAIVAIVILLFGYSFLKGENLLAQNRIFYAEYDDVEGLSPSSEVTINGLKVGQVSSIEFKDNSGRLVVSFTVKNDFKFSKNSKVNIYGGSIIGGKSLAIVPNYDQKSEWAVSGDTLQGDKEEGIMELVNDKLTPLQNKLENTITSADSMLTAITEILDDSTMNNIRGTFKNLDATVSSFRVTADELQGIVKGNSSKIDRTFTNLDEMSTNFNKFSDTLSTMNIGKITSDLEKVIADFEGISNKLNSKEGTAGKLINDDAVYNNLDQATKQLEQLLQDIKLNPKRYVHFSVFGKKAGDYEEPEDSLK
ncbi:MlaD family protein [Christiangramia sp. OXR-203]|uniref:MlaD family protein n=1 Tax=Christiangramia sp. OXR-203 TaxID=3100176 RepID=UPI002AC94AD0|nr:MlaD family protein [Christiangramia sp. OXR-203]WPY97113.1 MlaD family protein [Christiangramia sp. OXR-203]